jgi:hypothetical protein
MFLFLRVVSGLLVLSVLFQATTMGLYLDGHDSMLGMHRGGASLVGGLSILQVVAALLYFGRHRGRQARIVLTTSVGTLVAIILQMALGYTHSVAIHVPLGVALMAGLVRLSMMVLGLRDTPAAVQPAAPAESEPAA